MFWRGQRGHRAAQKHSKYHGPANTDDRCHESHRSDTAPNKCDFRLSIKSMRDRKLIKKKCN